jgi:putative transposase
LAAASTVEPPARDEALTAAIEAIHAESTGTYGSPRIHAVLKRRGERVARKRVARLMRTVDLVGCAARRPDHHRGGCAGSF